jgi:hypothetical protein
MLKNKGLIDVIGIKKLQHLCDSCQLGKLSHLPFSKSEHTSSTGIFEKIHCDLWGPALVLSIAKFKYYACLVDDFSKYSWIIPLRNKSDFFNAYLDFEKYVTRQFNKQIKIFHSDGGGEFINSKLLTHFLSTGIVHQISSPYTPEQTSIVERRHRTIRELGMTMLFHSGAPLFLWIKAFTTAVYLMNCLPSSALNFETPYFALHGTHPNYPSLRAFGSKCFPYTWDIRKHKFDPKTLPCIFIGYSEKHKAYKCFHPTSKKNFISRHVVFDELIFPYKPIKKSFKTTNQPQVISIFDSWLPHTNISSSTGAITDSASPPCQSLLLPNDISTPQNFSPPTDPTESQQQYPVVESQTSPEINADNGFAHNTISSDTSLSQGCQESHGSAQEISPLIISETPESSP